MIPKVRIRKVIQRHHNLQAILLGLAKMQQLKRSQIHPHGYKHGLGTWQQWDLLSQQLVKSYASSENVNVKKKKPCVTEETLPRIGQLMDLLENRRFISCSFSLPNMGLTSSTTFLYSAHNLICIHIVCSQIGHYHLLKQKLIYAFGNVAKYIIITYIC